MLIFEMLLLRPLFSAFADIRCACCQLDAVLKARRVVISFDVASPPMPLSATMMPPD